MLATLLCTLLPWLPADEAGKSEFTALAKKFETVQSYHFEFAATTTRDGGDAPAGGAAAGGAAAGGEAKGGGKGGGGEPWIVDWQRGKPVHLRRSETECFRSEKKVALFDAKKKEWVGLDRQAAGGGAAKPADGEAKAGGAPEGGASAEGEEKARGNQKRVVAEVDQILFPHVLMKQLGPKVGDVTRSGAGDTVTYVAVLDKETAREYSGQGERGGRREGGGRQGREGRKDGGGGAKGGDGGAGQGSPQEGGKPQEGGARQGRGEPELDGKLTVVATKGVISSIEIEVAVKGPQTRVVRKSMKVSAIDATAVEPPAEAAAALGIQ